MEHYNVYFYISPDLNNDNHGYIVMMANYDENKKCYDVDVLCKCSSLSKAILIVECCNTIYK